MRKDIKVLGRIDCPSCGYKDGMRITHDKNGHPFGYCDASCGQQLRIGGDPRRVRDFIARHPWAAGVQEQEEKPVTVTEKKMQEKEPVKVEEKPVSVTKKRASAWDVLGVGNG